MLLILSLSFSFAAAILAKTSSFKLELSWDKGAPDGYERDMIFINGQYPGPALEITQGDWVEIEVLNNLPFNSSIHAHGIHQIDTPWSDGVPGLTQSPIQPGASYKYAWSADTYGNYFYHCHSRGQIDDGCYGPIIIKPENGTPNAFSVVDPEGVELLEEAESNATPIILSDWRHRTSDETWKDQLASGVETANCVDALLINGKGAVNCRSREDIDAFVNPGIAPVLKANGLSLTDKGCFPPQLFGIIRGHKSNINVQAIPPEVFEICTPTQIPPEVIYASKGKKWMALDVVSTASIATFSFSIDEHHLWVYAVDGHYIEPVQVDVLSVANGDRYSVFIEMKNATGDFGIRVASLAAVQTIDTIAIFSYGNETEHHPYKNNTDIVSSKPFVNRGGRPISQNTTVFNQTSMVSFPPQFPQPPPDVAQTFILNLTTAGETYTWALNSTQFDHPVLDDTDPPFLWQQPNANNPGGNITMVTMNNTWVDLIFLVHEQYAPPHPIHKHSNKAFILGAGEGAWNWTSIEEAVKVIPQKFNLVNPPYRDGFTTPPTTLQPTWLAVRYHVVNPGPFMLHCHIQSHLNGGMAMIMLDGVDEWPDMPAW